MKEMTDNLNKVGLDADRLELLDYLLEEEGIEKVSELQKIGRRLPCAELPLSFAQQRLWFLDQLAPGSAAYNLSGRLRLEGQLDAASLEASLNEIVRRHEALRTIFSTYDGEPVQIILSELRLALPLIDLSHLPAAGRETAICQPVRSCACGCCASLNSRRKSTSCSFRCTTSSATAGPLVS
jgi:hypothetical protein